MPHAPATFLTSMITDESPENGFKEAFEGSDESVVLCPSVEKTPPKVMESQKTGSS